MHDSQGAACCACFRQESIGILLASCRSFQFLLFRVKIYSALPGYYS